MHRRKRHRLRQRRRWVRRRQHIEHWHDVRVELGVDTPTRLELVRERVVAAIAFVHLRHASEHPFPGNIRHLVRHVDAWLQRPHAAPKRPSLVDGRRRGVWHTVEGSAPKHLGHRTIAQPHRVLDGAGVHLFRSATRPNSSARTRHVHTEN